MILTAWLDQPVWLIFTLLAAVFALATVLLCLLSNLPPTRPLLHKLGLGIVAPYFNAISVMLALLTGFVANDAWERQRQASRIVQSEKTNLLAAHDLSLATASDMSGIRRRLTAYAEALIDDEWPKMTDGASSITAGEALGALMQAVADPRHTTEAGAVAHGALLDAVMNLRAARGERLGLSDAQGDQSKWLTLMVLAGLTLVALALIHVDKPAPQAVTLVLFSAAMVTTLGVIALHERPFDGPLALSSAPLENARMVMAGQ
jgi:xanthosine utilization system XapX-like protein